MKAFPMFIRTSGRRAVIVGGGEQAAQKARLLLKTDAQIVLVAPSLEAELEGLVDEGRAAQVSELTQDVLKGAAMVFVGTGCPGLDAAVHGLAKAAGCIVNVVDQPALCDMTTPSIVDRDPIVVAIGSEGTSPVLTRQIKTQLEQSLPQNLGGLAALAGRLRPSVARSVPRAQRRAFWAWVFKAGPMRTWARGAEREAARDIKRAIANGGAPEGTAAGQISLVGAGPGARDLLTLRAVQRLQDADVIFYDRLVDEEVLELARRDAERVFVGKHVGAHTFPQDRINQMIVTEALKGQRVVRLKSGDPGIFGRAAEEIETARAAGISVDVVPGVTAASAAAASLTRGLTERGQSDALILATGTGQGSSAAPDATRLSGPGTTTAFYMSVGQAARLSEDLMTKGLPERSPVDICVNVSKPHALHLSATVATMPEVLRAHNVTGSAVLLVAWPKDLAVQTQQPAPVLFAG